MELNHEMFSHGYDRLIDNVKLIHISELCSERTTSTLRRYCCRVSTHVWT